MKNILYTKIIILQTSDRLKLGIHESSNKFNSVEKASRIALRNILYLELWECRNLQLHEVKSLHLILV